MATAHRPGRLPAWWASVDPPSRPRAGVGSLEPRRPRAGPPAPPLAHPRRLWASADVAEEPLRGVLDTLAGASRHTVALVTAHPDRLARAATGHFFRHAGAALPEHVLPTVVVAEREAFFALTRPLRFAPAEARGPPAAHDAAGRRAGRVRALGGRRGRVPRGSSSSTRRPRPSRDGRAPCVRPAGRRARSWRWCRGPSWTRRRLPPCAPEP